MNKQTLLEAYEKHLKQLHPSIIALGAVAAVVVGSLNIYDAMHNDSYAWFSGSTAQESTFSPSTMSKKVTNNSGKFDVFPETRKAQYDAYNNTITYAYGVRWKNISQLWDAYFVVFLNTDSTQTTEVLIANSCFPAGCIVTSGAVYWPIKGSDMASKNNFYFSTMPITTTVGQVMWSQNINIKHTYQVSQNTDYSYQQKKFCTGDTKQSNNRSSTLYSFRASMKTTTGTGNSLKKKSTR